MPQYPNLVIDANLSISKVGQLTNARLQNVTSAGRNFDSEGNIAATYPYACSWHDRVRAAALSGMHNASTQPGVPGNENSIVVLGHPTPDGTPL